MSPRSLFAILATTGCAGSHPSITGTVTVDQKPFESTTCFVGGTAGFFGVDLVGKDGSTLRLSYHPAGKAIVYLFAPQATTGVEMGECGPMSLTNIHLQHARGSANLNCTANGHTITAPDLRFSSCKFER